MTAETPRAKIIVNPVAGARSTARRWPRIKQLLTHVGLKFDFQFTEGAGHAVGIAREAAGSGYRYIVAVGGDGTIHEVANGILTSSGALETTIGVIGTGTGGDFIRSLGTSRDYVPACSAIANPRQSRVDVGEVEYQVGSERRRRFFINGAGLGFDAAVVQSVERYPKYLGGTLPYVAGLLRTILRYRNKSIHIRRDDHAEQDAKVVTVVVANGGFFGGGMHVAPRANLRDGKLDLVIVHDLSRLGLLKAFPKVYKGTHTDHPSVTMEQTTSLVVEGDDSFLVHADGELLGTGPVSFRVMPGALSVAA